MYEQNDAERDDFEISMLTSEREAFAGFSNLAAMLPLPTQGQATPWREFERR